MRNAALSRDAVAQAAAMRALEDQGTAVDMVLAGLLAGATRAGSTALLGAGAILVGGPGVGMFFVDGRARAPGLGERRPKTPDEAPATWRAAVPGLLEAVLAAHARFATLSLSQVAGASIGALRDEGDLDEATRSRMKALDQFRRLGIPALTKMGVFQSVLANAGLVRGGGVFTPSDLVARPAPVVELVACCAGVDDVTIPPRGASRVRTNDPAPLPEVQVESLVVADMRGVMAAACWTVAAEAIAVEDAPGLALPALLPPPKKGVPRWRPGAVLPTPLPLAMVRRDGRVWAAGAVSGRGDVTAARDRAVTARLAQVGIELAVGRDGAGAADESVALWMVRAERGDEVLPTMMAV